MNNFKSNLIIGYHGCDACVQKELLLYPNVYKISQKPFDWLGHGLYFWENNYDRALQWAISKEKRGAIHKPAVIGAVLKFGNCCDLMEAQYIDLLAQYYNTMKIAYQTSGIVLPENLDAPADIHKNKLLRNLDCAVIEFMHAEISLHESKKVADGHVPEDRAFDSVRGVFIEGGPIYEGAGFFDKTHIQICVRNQNCIIGFFKPREEVNYTAWLQQRANYGMSG